MTDYFSFFAMGKKKEFNESFLSTCKHNYKGNKNLESERLQDMITFLFTGLQIFHGNHGHISNASSEISDFL